LTVTHNSPIRIHRWLPARGRSSSRIRRGTGPPSEPRDLRNLDAAGLSHRKKLEQIDVDLRALDDILPELYNLAVSFVLERAEVRIHTATAKAVKLAFEMRERVRLTRRKVVRK